MVASCRAEYGDVLAGDLDAAAAAAEQGLGLLPDLEWIDALTPELGFDQRVILVPLTFRL